MLSLLKLKYYCSVVETGSFTKAGKVNHVSQTSITQQIREIEIELDRKLIDRNTKPITLTKTGKVLYDEAKKVLRQYDIFQAKMSNYIESHQQKLIVGYATPLDLDQLNHLLSLSNESQITVLKQNISEISQSLKSRKIDLAISFSSEIADNKKFETVTLTEGNFIACVNKRHPLAEKETITMKEVYQYPLIMLDPKIIGKSYNKMAHKTEKLGLKLNIVDTVDDVESELFLLAHNQYVGFLPDKYPIDQSQLRKLKVVDSPHDYKIVLVKLKSNHDLKTNEFFEYGKNNFHKFS